jgi:hypothetical protein
MRKPSSTVVHGCLQAVGVLAIAVGVALWSLPAGIVVAGVGIIVLSVAAEYSS